MDYVAEAAGRSVVADGVDGRPWAFVQWKNTELSMEFSCPCGLTGYIDDTLCYVVQCPRCDRRFELAPTVLVRPMDDSDPAVPATRVLRVD